MAMMMVMMILGARVVYLATILTRETSRLVATTCLRKRGPWRSWPRNLCCARPQTTRPCRLGTLWS
eukprot:6650645-Pyramimonas_sp.AAC.1